MDFFNYFTLSVKHKLNLQWNLTYASALKTMEIDVL